MKTKLLLIISLMLLGYDLSFAQSGTLDFSFNPGSGANNWVLTTSIQADGKIIIGGSFTSYNGTVRNYIARLNIDGSLDTSFNPGAGASNWLYISTIQADGKIIIGGIFNFYNGTARNGIARLNTDGSLDTSFDPGIGANDGVYAASIQPDGKIIIGGQFTSYNGTARKYIARLNTDGSLDTSFDPGLGANSTVFKTSIQLDGKIIIGGQFTSYNGTARNYIARLNVDGSLDTSFNPGAGANNAVWRPSIQNDGKIVICGWFTSYNGTARNRIARLNIDGSLDTSFDPGMGANSDIQTNFIQPDGKIIIGGNFTSYNGTSRNYIARLNTDGSLDAFFDPGMGANSRIHSILLQTNGKIIIGGSFTSYNGTSRNRVARLFDCPFTTSSQTETTCDSYIWNGNTYTASGTYVVTIPNVVGCDSIMTLNLTINNNTGTDVQTACDFYTWIDGNTYTASNNTAKDTLTNMAGCDSVVTLNLTINNNTGIDVQTACDSYTWFDGNTYTASNSTAKDTLTNIAGCDSVVTLNLIINNSNTSLQTETACDSYLWNGNTYTTSNTYLDTILNAVGCDSVMTLNLTINPIPVVSFTLNPDTVCINVAEYTLTGGSPSGGTYSGVGVSAGNFNPDTAGVGIHTITYTYIDTNSCADNATSQIVVDVCTGIYSVSNMQNINIYPNPNNGSFKVKHNLIGENYTLEIIDLMGKVVDSEKITTAKQTINTQQLSKGLYFVTIKTDAGKLVYTSKMSVVR